MLKDSKPEFKRLYKQLTTVYQQVQMKFNIPGKQKHFEKYETRLGCLYLAILAAGLGVVIYGLLSWYWLGLMLLGIVILAGTVQKQWDLEYVNVFMEKMKEERQKDSEFFALVLAKWVKNLPKTDRAKKKFQTILKEISPETSEPDEPEYEENYVYDENNEYDEYEKDLPNNEELSSPSTLTTPPILFPPVKNEEPPAPPVTREQEEEESIICARCGSDWIRYEEKDEEEIFCVCENCSKKWKL